MQKPECMRFGDVFIIGCTHPVFSIQSLLFRHFQVIRWHRQAPMNPVAIQLPECLARSPWWACADFSLPSFSSSPVRADVFRMNSWVLPRSPRRNLIWGDMIHHRDWVNLQGGCRALARGALRQGRAYRRRRVGLGEGLE